MKNRRFSRAKWVFGGFAAASAASFVSLATAVVAAHAESDADRGLALATQWCNSCHVVQQNDPGMDDAEYGPPFATVTQYTAPMLKQLFAKGHADMDALAKLSDDDLAAIAAHLHRLKPEPRTR
jgi:mono/diheme cytochrome c family protein